MPESWRPRLARGGRVFVDADTPFRRLLKAASSAGTRSAPTGRLPFLARTGAGSTVPPRYEPSAEPQPEAAPPEPPALPDDLAALDERALARLRRRLARLLHPDNAGGEADGVALARVNARIDAEIARRTRSSR